MLKENKDYIPQNILRMYRKEDDNIACEQTYNNNFGSWVKANNKAGKIFRRKKKQKERRKYLTSYCLKCVWYQGLSGACMFSRCIKQEGWYADTM